MASTKYTYQKKCDAGRLKTEIDSSVIIIGLDYIRVNGSETTVWMKGALSQADNDELDAIVINHIDEPLEDREAMPVRIDEGDFGFTGGHTLIKGFCVEVTQQGINTEDFTFPFPVAVFSATWFNDGSNHYEDTIELHVAPDTPIGQPTADLADTDDAMSVPQTVLDNAGIGYWLTLVNALDPSDTHDCGQVIAMSNGSMSVKFVNAVTKAWPAATTIINMTIKVAENVHIMGQGFEAAGSAKIGGSPVPANRVIRAVYVAKDTPPADYTFHFRLQMSY